MHFGACKSLRFIDCHLINNRRRSNVLAYLTFCTLANLQRISVTDSTDKDINLLKFMKFGIIKNEKWCCASSGTANSTELIRLFLDLDRL